MYKQITEIVLTQIQILLENDIEFRLKLDTDNKKFHIIILSKEEKFKQLFQNFNFDDFGSKYYLSFQYLPNDYKSKT